MGQSSQELWPEVVPQENAPHPSTLRQRKPHILDNRATDTITLASLEKRKSAQINESPSDTQDPKKPPQRTRPTVAHDGKNKAAKSGIAISKPHVSPMAGFTEQKAPSSSSHNSAFHAMIPKVLKREKLGIQGKNLPIISKGANFVWISRRMRILLRLIQVPIRLAPSV